jgi:hypothetical protein
LNGVRLKNKRNHYYIPAKEKGAPRDAFFIIAYFLPFGLALVAPVAVFFAEPGAAFFAVAFVAILVICI